MKLTRTTWKTICITEGATDLMKIEPVIFLNLRKEIATMNDSIGLYEHAIWWTSAQQDPDTTQANLPPE